MALKPVFKNIANLLERRTFVNYYTIPLKEFNDLNRHTILRHKGLHSNEYLIKSFIRKIMDNGGEKDATWVDW
jgi:hypothetical protein